MLEVRGLTKHFPAGGMIGGWRSHGWVKAVDGIDFSIGAGETLGPGRRVRLRQDHDHQAAAAAGATRRPARSRFEGRDVAQLKGKDLLAYRQAVQAVFQDPYSSLSPRMRVGDIIGEPLEAQGEPSTAGRSATAWARRWSWSGCDPEQARLFPHEFSGGQRQRIAIARAIATNARLIILDEPVSALDVSIRAQIMTLLEDLQQQLGVSYLFIGHDLATVTHISHRIAVMYLGQDRRDRREPGSVPESAPSVHPGAVRRRAAVATRTTRSDELVVTGEVPSALNPPSGCRFHPRCPFVMPRCSERPAGARAARARTPGRLLPLRGWPDARPPPSERPRPGDPRRAHRRPVTVHPVDADDGARRCLS